MTAYLRPFFLQLLLMLLANLPLQASAEKEIQAQPIHIEADRFYLDFLSGLSTYEGMVTAHQGLKHLTGDQLVIHSNERGEVIEVIVTGTPAHYDYQTDGSGKKAVAQALTIRYEPEKNLLTLIEEAKIEQDGNVFTGPLITYNASTEVIDSPTSDNGRSSMVLKPGMILENEDS